MADDPAVTDPEVGLAVREKSLVVLPQPGRVSEALRVFQTRAPVVARYSWVYQKVQPSAGSMLIEE